MQDERVDVDAVVGIVRVRHYVRWYIQEWLDDDHTQVELVRMSGINQGAVSLIACGKDLPGMENCALFARAFGMGFHALIERACACREIDGEVQRFLKTPRGSADRRRQKQAR